MDRKRCYLEVVVTYFYVEIKIIQTALLRGRIFYFCVPADQADYDGYCQFSFFFREFDTFLYVPSKMKK